jgi:hypothetical protein
MKRMRGAGLILEQIGRVIAVNKMLNDRLSRFGFRTDRGGGHGARTTMLEELRALLSFVDDADASREAYVKSIEVDSCFGKRSGGARKITARLLIEPYALDSPWYHIFNGDLINDYHLTLEDKKNARKKGC